MADFVSWLSTNYYPQWPANILIEITTKIQATLMSQEPFHTLNPELLEDLTEKQCQQLNKALPKVDLSALLGTLYEFIETFIRHIDLNNLEKKRDWQ